MNTTASVTDIATADVAPAPIYDHAAAALYGARDRGQGRGGNPSRNWAGRHFVTQTGNYNRNVPAADYVVGISEEKRTRKRLRRTMRGVPNHRKPLRALLAAA